MKTKIPIKKYVMDEDTKLTIEHLLGPNAATGRLLENAYVVAKEYKKLEAHHEEETKFLIQRIEELETENQELREDYSSLLDQLPYDD